MTITLKQLELLIRLAWLRDQKSLKLVLDSMGIEIKLEPV